MSMIIENLLSLITLHLVAAVWAGTHVLLNKRNSRAALGWLGLIIVFPLAGALLYAMFGINRVRRKARRVAQEFEPEADVAQKARSRPGEARLTEPGRAVTGHVPTAGNRVKTLFNGEQAFPAMLTAIDSARREVLLSSYIFDNDDTGRAFSKRLEAARNRPLNDMVGGGPFGLAPGQWTDDTAMALCLAESLIQCQGFNLSDQMDRYIRWFRTGYLSSTGRCSDIGNTIQAVLIKYERSVDPIS